jgi:hypothetical protein
MSKAKKFEEAPPAAMAGSRLGRNPILTTSRPGLLGPGTGRIFQRGDLSANRVFQGGGMLPPIAVRSVYTPVSNRMGYPGPQAALRQAPAPIPAAPVEQAAPAAPSAGEADSRPEKPQGFWIGLAAVGVLAVVVLS